MFQSYQTILRELSCLVVKLLRAAYFCTSLVMLQRACNYKVCLKTSQIYRCYVISYCLYMASKLVRVYLHLDT